MNRWSLVAGRWSFLAFTLMLAPAVSRAQVGGEPTLSWIDLDFLGNLPATDRLIYHVNDGFGTAYGSDETYPNAEGRPLAVVYVRGSSVSVKLKFRNNCATHAYSGNLVMDSATFTEDYIGPPGGGNPTAYPMGATGGALNIPAGGTAEVTVTFSSLPDHVSRGRITFEAHTEGNFGVQIPGAPPVAWSGGGPMNQMFVTYAAPADSQALVWTDVLHYTTSWAMGKATENEVAEYLTKGLYYGKIFAYNLGTPGMPTQYLLYSEVVDPPIYTYMLEKLLRDKGAPIYGMHFDPKPHQPGNCYDINGFLTIAMESLGIPSESLETAITGDYAYITNPFCPIGSDSTQTGLYVQVRFTNHFQSVRSGSIVSDAALGYYLDLNLSTWMNPAWNWVGVSNGHVRSTFQSFPQGLSCLPAGQCYRQFMPGIDALTLHGAHHILVVIPDVAFPPTWFDSATDWTCDFNYPFVKL